MSLPPHRRRIGYVFQDGRLFPHMTVAQNLDYGRRMYRLPHDADAQARIVALLDIGAPARRGGPASSPAASASASRSAARC